MSEAATLSAEPRDRVGKGAARATRREGNVPAVIYGGGEDPVSIAIDMPQIVRTLNKGKFLSTIFNVNVGDKTIRVIPKDIQYHVVTDVPWHIDFLRVSKDAMIPVNVAVQFINQDKSPGLKRGGVLNVVRHEVELLAPADAIPNELVVDLEGFDINESIHISAIKLPEKTSPTITDRDFTVATIAAPSGGVGDEDEAEEGGEEA